MTAVLGLARVRRVLLLMWLVLACLGAVAATRTSPALAAGPCGTSGVFSQSGSTATCIYFYTGADQTFTTPDGRLTLHVEAVGAPGGDFRDVAPGGAGGTAQATIQAPPSHLVVEVGGPGGPGGTAGAAPGGFGGGGSGGVDAGGGGGGASEVCVPAGNLGCDPGSSTGGQLFVAAAGGGGAGAANPPGAGAGGPAGQGGRPGANVTDAIGTILVFGGGGGGAGAKNGTDTGGLGGIGGRAIAGGTNGGAGQDGTLHGQGGNGGAGASNPFGAPGGGGGGGGFIGGGGGGGGGCGPGCSGGGGGGGGSSFGSNTGVAPPGTPPSVKISYAVNTTTTTVSAPTTATTNDTIAASSIGSLLSGGTTSPAVGGTITFKVFGPQSDAPTDCTTGGTEVGTTTVASNGSYLPSKGFTPDKAGTYWWYASYGGDSLNAPSNSGCGSDNMANTVVANPAISLAKAADQATVSAGDTIGFRITATNAGAGDARGVTVTDPLPTAAGVAWSVDAANSDSGCTISGGVLTCNFGTVASGASKAVHVTSATTKDSCGALDNLAAVSTSNDGSAQASASTTVNCPQQLSQITPGKTTCEEFSGDTAQSLSTLQYSIKRSLINQVNPGVFVYWVKVTTSVAGTNTFTLHQDVDPTSFAKYLGLASGSGAFSSTCVRASGVRFSQSGADTTVRFTAPAAGSTYYLGVKYDAKSLKGFAPPPPPGTATYTFSTSTLPASAQSINLAKK